MISFDLEYSVFEAGQGKSSRFQLENDLDGEATLLELLQFLRGSLIVIADEVLREEQAIGFDKNPIVAVDGRVGKPVADVSPFGSIEFNSRVSIDELVLDTYQGILDRSPVLTGEYKSSHYVFLNGNQIATSMEGLRLWLSTKPQLNDKDIIRFVNIVPYARKLERLGVTAQRTQNRRVSSRDKRGRSGSGGKILVPNGAYFLTSRSVKRKYKRNSSIKFGFIAGSALGLKAAFKSQTGGARGGGSKKIRRGRTYLYPTITIQVAEAGLT